MTDSDQHKDRTTCNLLNSQVTRLGWIFIFFTIANVTILLVVLVVSFIRAPEFFLSSMAKYPIFNYEYAGMILVLVFLFFTSIRIFQVRKKKSYPFLYFVSAILVGIFFTLIFLVATYDFFE